MSDYKLTLSARDESGKKAKLIRDSGKIPSVVYGGKTPLLTASDYNETEKVLRAAGYHSPIDLEIDKKTILGIVKTVALDPVSRKIINIEFNEIKKNALVEATTPIKIENFEASDASKAHLALLQVMEEIDVKAKPSDLPKELVVDASRLASVEDKLTLENLILPTGVELADKDLDPAQVIASLSDPAVEAEKREEEEKNAEEVSAADVPADNGQKPEEKPEAGQ
ncbi:50S ribosomal protein L25 [Candidatus Saccharibacteria bacterium]|nr:50S ribosomal protein L25 [Candidatus Saccharibacteria bacterium]